MVLVAETVIGKDFLIFLEDGENKTGSYLEIADHYKTNCVDATSDQSSRVDPCWSALLQNLTIA